MFVVALRCVLCGTAHQPEEVEGTCPACGVEGILEVELDEERAAAADDPNRPPGMWRHAELVPVADPDSLPDLSAGPTPLIPAPRLAEALGLADLLLKDDGRNPTGSLKDRASALAVGRARERGRRELACASTGNAASSLAGMCASAGMTAHIFVPASIPRGKLAQLRVYGADVTLVEGGYDQAYEMCMEACRDHGWENRNAAVNPYLVEGKKTCGHEIADQVAGAPPDWVCVSVGDGCTLAGIWKGLGELHRRGTMPRLPRLLAVQAAGAGAVHDAFVAGGERIQPRPAVTRAESIAVGRPRNAVKALRALRASDGASVLVEDEAIMAAQLRLGRATGVFAEPAAAAAFAGVERARELGLIGRGERVLCVLTGHGLKDVESVGL
ncbi:MAG: threonine synthase [Gaiellales bacterium]